MKLWLVIYAMHQVVLALGPLPSDLNSCEASLPAYKQTLGKYYAPSPNISAQYLRPPTNETTMYCVWSAKKPG